MVTIDSKGRIVLPNEVRRQLGLRPGTEVAVNAESGRVIVEPEDAPEEVIQDLEKLIDESAANREHRREGEAEGLGLTLDDDSIAAEQREIIRRGATRPETDDPDDQDDQNDQDDRE